MRICAVSSLTDQIFRSGMRLNCSWLMGFRVATPGFYISALMLSLEKRCCPKDRGEYCAQQQAGDNRKIKRKVGPLVNDVAGKAAQAKRQSHSEQEEPADRREDYAHDEE